MSSAPLRLVVLGLSITSSWGNGHATNYRALVRAAAARGHEVLFLERDVPWYAEHRDLAHPPYGTTALYGSLEQLRDEHTDAVRDADLVVVGSYVPEGIDVGRWVQATAQGVTAFYDIDTPVTLGYLGTWSADRQPVLDELLVEPARRTPGSAFVVAGPQYPTDIRWPANVERIEHLPPAEHAGFYNAQHLTLNVTRADMVRAGWSPSVRLFEAAACGVPVVSDWWEGLDSFFTPEEEILVATSGVEVEQHLSSVDDERRAKIGAAARARVLAQHTAEHRIDELEEHVAQVRETVGR